jgi:hypothetical protein
LELKLLLKRGALVAAANWQTVLVQFAAQTMLQVLLAVPILGAAVLVTILPGTDLGSLLQGSLREIAARISDALLAEPSALAAFITACGIVLVGGSVFTFLVKGGTVSVLVAAQAASRPIEREPITFDSLRSAGAFTLERFMAGCGRLFRPYLTLGLLLMVVYGLSAAGYLAFVIIGYRAAEGRALVVEWTLLAALAAVLLVLWITLVNLAYLLLQVAIAEGAHGVGQALRDVVRFVRANLRALGSVFLVVLAVVVAATFASALAWSGVALIAFIPLVGLVVFPLQLVAWLVRGLVFEYIGLTALGAYIALYSRHLEACHRQAVTHEGLPTAAPAYITEK